jgi:DnaJ family protein C protein 3
MVKSSFTFAIIIAIFNQLTDLIECSMTKAEVDKHLEMGTKLLAAGQLADALNQFHTAIDGDPSNYMSFYRRGTVYLGMGKFKSALSDLGRVIELKPDFVSARMQRANVLVKQGQFADAIKDYETIVTFFINISIDLK